MKRAKPSMLRKPRFWFSLSVYERIRASIGSAPAETGGMLGSAAGRNVVSHFFLDTDAAHTAVTYTPDIKTVNTVLDQWNATGIRLAGFVHSHPLRSPEPSSGDRNYAARILSANPEIKFLLLPIVLSAADASEFSMRLFVASRAGDGVDIQRAQLLLFEDASVGPVPEKQEPPAKVVATVSCLAHRCGKNVPIPADFPFPCLGPSEPKMKAPATFERVRAAYDLDHLAQCCVVCVGVGGASLFVEHLARARIGRFVLIDPDIYTAPNLATQHCYARELDRPKVDCVASRIKEINRDAKVITRQCRLDDLDDDAFAALICPQDDQLRPAATLLCGCTDSFSAQARTNRLALHLGVPALLSQVYQRGLAAEAVWVHPAVSQACARCILSARYRAMLHDGFRNITADGTPIYATLRLNAVEVFLALALLHHGTRHPRWGRILARLGNRQLVQVRCDPDAEAELGFQNFSQAFHGVQSGQLFSDESIWRPQEPECPATGYPPCPDCAGDARACVGKFVDTRTMPPQP